MSTAKFDTLQNAAGNKSVLVSTVVDGSAKAWVNFNGVGTVAIRSALNVTSITDTGTGQYAVNFTTAMPNTDYAIIVGNAVGSAADTGNAYSAGLPVSGMIKTTSAFSLLTRTNNSPADQGQVNVAVFS